MNTVSLSTELILDANIWQDFTFAETLFGFINAADSRTSKEPGPKHGGNARILQVSQCQEEKEQNIPLTLFVAVLSLD